jgi:DNA-binding transcriptional LysR family regulator
MTLAADDLLLFARVVETGSFSAAAERVGLPKSTVSRRISALERAAGERLLQRTTRKLSLTAVGQDLLEHARQIAATVDEAEAYTLHRQVRPSGRLRVTMAADVALTLFMPTIAQFVRDHPAIQLELDLSPRRVDLVGENFDLALRMGPLANDAQLVARRVASFDGGLYAAPGYLARQGMLASPADLLACHALVVAGQNGEPLPWVLMREDGSQDGRERWQGLPAQHTAVNLPAMLLQLAEAEAGIAIASHVYAAAQVRTDRLVRVLPQWQLEPTPAWALYPSRRLLPARTRVFLDALITAAESGCSEGAC